MRANLITAFADLRASEERHRKLFETMRQGVVYQDQEGQLIAANPAALDILGVEEKELLSRASSDEAWDVVREDGSRVPPEERPGIVALHTGRPVMNEVLSVYNPKTKKYHWQRVNAIPLMAEGETKPYQVHITFDDITQRRKARETLTRYASIISSTKDMMSFVDDRYVYQAVNDSYLIHHGKEREEIIGKSIPELMGADTFNAVVKPNFDRTLNGETINFQAWFDYPKAGRRYMNVTYNPFKDDTGKVNGVVVTVSDLTDLRNTEEELQRLRK